MEEETAHSDTGIENSEEASTLDKNDDSPKDVNTSQIHGVVTGDTAHVSEQTSTPNLIEEERVSLEYEDADSKDSMSHNSTDLTGV